MITRSQLFEILGGLHIARCHDLSKDWTNLIKEVETEIDKRIAPHASPWQLRAMRHAFENESKLESVRLCRSLLGCTLIEAKRFVEREETENGWIVAKSF
jgi:ribosomal protein L7/L12